MKQDDVIDSLGRLDDDLIEQVQQLRQKPRKKLTWRRWVAVAVCAAAIAGTLLTAEASSGSVSNLLAPLFGVCQTELSDSIGKPVGVSASADGYTLTADAVIGDRYHVAIVYTLVKEDGTPLPDGLIFTDWNSSVLSGGSGGGSLEAVADVEDPSKIHFIESWSKDKPLIGQYVTATFSGLSRYDTDSKTDHLLSEGTWELHYTLRYKDATVKLPLHDLPVTDKLGGRYQLKTLYLSPFGLHLEGTYLDSVFGETDFMKNFEVSLRRSDGSSLDLHGACGSHQSDGKNTAQIHFSETFQSLIPLSEIKELSICGTVVPIQLP